MRREVVFDLLDWVLLDQALGPFLEARTHFSVQIFNVGRFDILRLPHMPVIFRRQAVIVLGYILRTGRCLDHWWAVFGLFLLIIAVNRFLITLLPFVKLKLIIISASFRGVFLNFIKVTARRRHFRSTLLRTLRILLYTRQLVLLFKQATVLIVFICISVCGAILIFHGIEPDCVEIVVLEAFLVAFIMNFGIGRGVEKMKLLCFAGYVVYAWTLEFGLADILAHYHFFVFDEFLDTVIHYIALLSPGLLLLLSVCCRCISFLLLEEVIWAFIRCQKGGIDVKHLKYSSPKISVLFWFQQLNAFDPWKLLWISRMLIFFSIDLQHLALLIQLMVVALSIHHLLLLILLLLNILAVYLAVSLNFHHIIRARVDVVGLDVGIAGLLYGWRYVLSGWR